MASPSLATNLSYDPFAPELPRGRRRREDEDLAAANTGFSPDGLSYSVADDYGKLSGQIWADYEAASRNPRGLFESPEEYKSRVSAAPQRLQQEIMSLRSMFGGDGSYQPKLPRLIETPTGIVEQDPTTGELTKKMDYPSKPAKDEEFPGPTGWDIMMNGPTDIRMHSAREWEKMLPMLPKPLQEIPQLKQYAEWGRQSNAPPAAASSPMATPSTPRKLRFNPQTQELEEVK